MKAGAYVSIDRVPVNGLCRTARSRVFPDSELLCSRRGAEFAKRSKPGELIIGGSPKRFLRVPLETHNR